MPSASCTCYTGDTVDVQMRLIEEESQFDKQQTTKATLTTLIQYTSIQMHLTGIEKSRW